MAESSEHEIQVGINVVQEQGQYDVSDVNSDNHCVREDIETVPYRPINPRPGNNPISSSRSHRHNVKPELCNDARYWEEYFSHFINCDELDR
jgi:hypothetical protein